MKILIIEDDETKIAQLTDLFMSIDRVIELASRKSYQSGLRELLREKYDLIILDMSMPIFDKTNNESGGFFERFAGEKILREMLRKKMTTKTILLTMFESFGEGYKTITLQTLNQKLKNNYSEFYIDCIHYNASESKWKNDLEKLLKDNALI